ncbi:flavodoxin [Paenibacillus lycopersici]|uniref:Flavodoxin n=1 Tax=Paenibacillus lycopersici TaxID=2704462 RepID=A0A6C0FX31_9BACL|nr:flavodoxin [Paenibacillus lycopersici]QHT58760.1 flavodoxin [Paenibacillus lycopersici]
MAKIVMIYASMTGNTEEMAEAVAQGIRSAGGELDVKMVMDAQVSDLLGCDGIVLGAYTWGDGELPDEFLDFYADMNGVDLSGTKSAVFGSCDSNYLEYGVAVDILIRKLSERGSDVVLEGLKVELSPNAEEKTVCRSFGEQLVQAIAKESSNGTAV